MNRPFYGVCATNFCQKNYGKFFAALFFTFFSSQIFAQNLEIENAPSAESRAFFLDLASASKTVAEKRQSVAAMQSRIDSAIDQRTATLNEIEAEITQIDFLNKKSSQPQLTKNAYENTAHYWRILVDDSLKFFSAKDDFSLEYPASLPEPITIPHDFQADILTTEYLSSRHDLAAEYAKYLVSKEQFIKIIKDRQSGLLLRIGKTRAYFFNKASPANFNYDALYFDDLIRELKLIPYRPVMFFYSKLLDYKELVNTGFKGVASIVSQILFLIFLLASLLCGTSFLKKADSFLEKLRENLIKFSFQNQERHYLAILTAKLIPYLSWICLIIIFNSAYFFIELTSLPEISLLLPYFTYYFLYRIFKIALFSILNRSISLDFSDVKLNNHLNKKIRDTSQVLGLYLLISACFLHLSDIIVRRAIVYSLVRDIFALGLIALLIYLAGKWRKEISACFSRKKPDAPAKLDGSKEIPATYLKKFKDAENDFIQINSHPYQQVKNTLASWLAGKSKENSMALCGEDGIGKTSLLNWVEKEFCGHAPDLKIIRLNFAKKITSAAELSKLVIEALEISEPASHLEKIVESYPVKTLIIFDCCENLFLAKRGGFAAFKFFADLVNVSSANIFWIASFHIYSWNYLSNATDHGNYFRHQLKLPRWSDVDIKNLITKKHASSGFKLVYDALIFAIQSQNSEKELGNIQEKFFQILWEQSRGNPTIAMDLWLSSLRAVNKSALKITLPKAPKFSDLIDLSDEQLFIYAAITKHHKLSLAEISEVTSLSKGVALNSIRIGVERGYLNKLEDGSYRLSDPWQILIPNLLIRKNFIYE